MGSSWIAGDVAHHAFLYDGSRMWDLNDLIDPESGWVLREARGINDAGWIAGWGYDSGEPRVRRGFLLIPEPGTVAMLLGAGLIGLLAWGRHRCRQT
ncbi:MAG: PEP-CTERM sorting domain-containing protein [Planctomycetota bacterium]